MYLVSLPLSHNIRTFLTQVLWDGGSSRFPYELLVHTPNTYVYRCISECIFTHFAPYVVNIETDVIVCTLPRPRGGRATIHSVSYSQNDIYCSTIFARLPEEAKSQSQG